MQKIVNRFLRKIGVRKVVYDKEDLIRWYKELGFHIGKYNRRVYTKDFQVGDIVYWLGEDRGPGKLNYGDKLIATEKIIRAKDTLPFYKFLKRIEI